MPNNGENTTDTLARHVVAPEEQLVSDREQEPTQEYAGEQIVRHYGLGDGRRYKVLRYGYGANDDATEPAKTIQQHLYARY